MLAFHPHNLLRRSAAARAHSLNLLHNVHSLDDLSEHHVVTVEPLGLHLPMTTKQMDNRRNEELRAVRVLSSVRHRQDTRSGVLQLEVLVGELLSIDGLAAGSVAVREVSSLNHEVGDDAVEDGSLVVERLSRLANSLLSCAQSTEVFHGLRHRLSEPAREGDDLAIQSHDDSSRLFSVNLDIEVDLVGDLGLSLHITPKLDGDLMALRLRLHRNEADRNSQDRNSQM